MMAQSPEAIATALGFTLDELALNRAGQISAHQTTEGIKAATGMLGLSVGFLGMTMVSLFSGDLGVVRLLVSAALLAGAVGTGVSSRTAWNGVRKVQVLTEDGALEFKYSRGGVKNLVVGKITTPLDDPSKASDVLISGERYRVYYLAGSAGQILSLEPCSAPSGAESASR